ncbi:MAG: DUF3883 domain-containing protein [Epulopiscium sp.]|nr:DUF3883 domain-containing protein [Candidatus Epulonipiscium sp.]
MSVNYKVFKKLLSIDELFELYSQIGDTILTHIDIENINKDKESKNNSIQLLIDTLLIAYDTESKVYYKKSVIHNKTSFISDLYKVMLNLYKEAFSFINEVDIYYDENEVQYYTNRNFISLDLSGLLMLLNGMGFIKVKDKYIYFLDKSLLINDRIKNKQRKISLLELKEQLDKQEQLGNEAEIVAIEFEKSILSLNNIDKVPEHVSLYDVSAGYDIVSYMASDSNVPDKFIEVKSCADESLQFYISRNELEAAKSKRNHYFLYLLNRKTNKFTVICDPYSVFFESEEVNWAIESQVYKIHSIAR